MANRNLRTVRRPEGVVTVPGTKAGRSRLRLPEGHPYRTGHRSGPPGTRRLRTLRATAERYEKAGRKADAAALRSKYGFGEDDGE